MKLAARRPLFLVALLCAGPLVGQETREELMAEYARRYRAIDKKNVEQLVELATWCKEKELETYANLLFRKALKIDPQHPVANAAMGNEEVGGKWYPPGEARAMRAKLEEAARAASGEKPEPERTSPLDLPDEPAATAKVKAAVGDNATKATELRDAYINAIGDVKAKYTAAISDHATIVARAPESWGEYLAQIAEYVYRRMNWITFGEEERHTFRQLGGKMAFYLANDPALEPTMDFLKKHMPRVTEVNDLREEIKFVRKFELQFTTMHWPPVHVHLNVENQPSAVANAMARTWLEHSAMPWHAELDITGGRHKEFSMMAWILEGVGVWASLDAVGSNLLYRIQKPRYANKKLIEKDFLVDYVSLAYDCATTGGSEGRTARTVYQLSRARMNTWHVLDLAMSFALADYLIRERTQDWRALVKRLKNARTFRGAFVEQFGTDDEKKRAREALTRTHRDGDLERAYREATERFEKEWKVWVAKAYESLRDDPEHYKRDAPFAVAPKRK